MTNKSEDDKQVIQDEADATVREKVRQDAVDMNAALRSSMRAAAAHQSPPPELTPWQRFKRWLRGLWK